MRRAAAVFAPPGLEGNAVVRRELPQRNRVSAVDVVVPRLSEHFALPVRQSVPWCLVYAILSFAHDVRFAYSG